MLLSTPKNRVERAVRVGQVIHSGERRFLGDLEARRVSVSFLVRTAGTANSTGLVVACEGAQGQAVNTCGINWIGGAGGTVLTINQTRYSTFSGFYVSTGSVGPSTANIAIDVNMRNLIKRCFWAFALFCCWCSYVHGQYPPALPQTWANNLESVPSGAWDKTKTFGIDYASTGAGLQQALTDWCNDPDEWFHMINPHGNVVSITSLMTACGKAGATKFFVIDSANPLTVSQTVC